MTKVKGFSLDRLIGTGRFSDVYDAAWELFGGYRLALKVAKTREVCDYLREQGRVQAGLSNYRSPSPYVVEVITDAWTEDGRACIGMELMTRSLRDALDAGHLRRGDKIDLTRALDYCAKIIQALGYVHRHGSCHGDLKPTNILLKTEGDCLRLSDISPKRKRGGDELESSLLEHEIAGAPAYIDPAGNSSPVLSDMYKLGVVVHELLTGRIPQAGKRPQDFNDEIGNVISDLVLECLENDPSRRVQSVDDFDSRFRNEVKADQAGRLYIVDRRSLARKVADGVRKITSRRLRPP